MYQGLCLLVLLAAPLEKAPADRWPQFRGVPSLTGHSAAAPQLPLSLLWRRTLTDSQGKPVRFRSSPVILSDRVYIGSDAGKVYCLELANGRTVWEFAVPDGWPVSATPLVDEKAVYVGDEGGTFYALDVQKGTPLWTFATEGQIVSSANAAANRLVFGSYDNFVYCLDSNTGQLVWKFETGSYVHATPAIAAGRVFVAGCDAVLHVLELETGKALGELDIEAQAGASPAIYGSIAYVGNMEDAVLAVDWRAQKRLWTYRAQRYRQPFYASAAVTEGLVLVGGRDRRLHAIDRPSGTARWHFRARARIDSSPVVAGSAVFFGSHDGNLYAVAVEDGRLLWRFPCGGRISASPAVANNRVVIATESGTILCFGR